MHQEKDEERFPKNAPGPFYVVNGECMTCLAPEHEAPDLMGFDEEARHCYFRKQPSTPEEFERAARTVCVSCCEAVRYSGDDPAVLQRIEELDEEARKWRQQLEEQQERQNKPWWKFW
ncbi:MAG TPA: hypothetical protein VFD58_22695 [Blastocatellia bacterium]|nr:hypothetical protein [Blastocatellia bacterium]